MFILLGTSWTHTLYHTHYTHYTTLYIYSLPHYTHILYHTIHTCITYYTPNFSAHTKVPMDIDVGQEQYTTNANIANSNIAMKMKGKDYDEAAGMAAYHMQVSYRMCV